MRKGKKVVVWLLCFILAGSSCLTSGTLGVFAETADTDVEVTMSEPAIRLEGKQGLRFTINLTQFRQTKDYGIEIRHNGKTAIVSKEQGFSKISKWDKKADTAEYAAVVTDISKKYLNQSFEATGFVTYEKNGKETKKRTKTISVTMQQVADKTGCMYDDESGKWVTEVPTANKTNAKEPSISLHQMKAETKSETKSWNGLPIAKMDDGVTANVQSDGSLLLQFTDVYQKIYFWLPDNTTAEDYFSATVDVNIEEQFGFALTDAEGSIIKEEYPGYDVGYSSDHQYTLPFDAPGSAADGRTMADGRMIQLQTLKSASFGNPGRHANIILKDLKLIPRKTSEETGPTLLDAYGKIFDHIGNAGDLANLQNPNDVAYYKTEYNSFTLGNQMKPDYILRKNGEKTLVSATDAKEKYGYIIPDDYTEDTVPKLYFDVMDEALKLAQENGIQMRGHTLIWHQQTPSWFFKEGYQNNGAFVSPDVMNARVKFYVANVMEHVCNGAYKDVIYAWDVTNEYLHQGTDPNKSGWIGVYGDSIVKNGTVSTEPEYVKIAFQTADAILRKTGLRDKVHLFYNDYNTYGEINECIALINYLNKKDTWNAEGVKLCDGIGMQSHLDVMWPSVDQYLKAMDAFRKAGFEIQITELDVTLNMLGNQNTEAERLVYWKDLMEGILKQKANGADITAFIIWGMYDAGSWRAQYTPLLWGNSYYDKKEAYQIVLDAAKTYTGEVTKPSQPSTSAEPSQKPGTSVKPSQEPSTSGKPSQEPDVSMEPSQQPSVPAGQDKFHGFTVAKADASVTTKTNTDGSITVSFTDKYQGVYLAFPKGKTAADYDSVTVDVSTAEQFALGLMDANMTQLKQDYPGYSVSSETRATYTLGMDDLENGAKASDGCYLRLMTLDEVKGGKAKHTPITIYGVDTYKKDNGISTPSSGGPSQGSSPENVTEPSKSSQPGSATEPSKSSQPGSATEPSKSSQPGSTTQPSQGTQPGSATEPEMPIEPEYGENEIPRIYFGTSEEEEPSPSKQPQQPTDSAIASVPTEGTKPEEPSVPSEPTMQPSDSVSSGVSSPSRTSEVSEIPSHVSVPAKPSSEEPTKPSSEEPTKPSEEPSKSEQILVQRIKVPKSSLTLVVGEKKSIGAKVEPSKATNKTLTYDSQKKSIAMVSASGKVTAKKPGKTTIKIKASNGVKKTIYITVKPKKVSGFKAKPEKTSIRLSWKKSKDITAYQIYKYDPKKKAYKLYKTVKGTSLTVKNLKKNTTYKFKIRAYKSCDGAKLYGAYAKKASKTKK